MNNYRLTIPIDKNYMDKRIDFAIILCAIVCLCLALLLLSGIMGISLGGISVALTAISIFLVVLLACFFITKRGNNSCVIFTENAVFVNHILFSNTMEFREGEYIRIKKDMLGKSCLLTNSNRTNMSVNLLVDAYPGLLEKIIDDVPYILPE